MGKMHERIRTIDCPLSKKRVFRGVRITNYDLDFSALARGRCGAKAQRNFGNNAGCWLESGGRRQGGAEGQLTMWKVRAPSARARMGIRRPQG